MTRTRAQSGSRALRLRFGVALLALLCALLATKPWLVATLAAPALPQLLARSTGRHALARRLRASLPLLAAVLIAGIWSAAMSGRLAGAAGLERAGLLGLRVLAATVWSSWLSHDLSGAQIELGLRACGVPHAFVSLLSATRRFGQQLRATLQAAWAACALRGGLLSLRALSQTLGAVAGVVVVRSLDRSEHVALAEALRGGGYAADAATRDASELEQPRELPQPRAAR